MPSVLIVDDEQHIRLLIEQTLEPLEDDGVELLTAPDGEAALDGVQHHRPRLVFLDVMMPKRNGFDVCRAIKQEMGLADTTVVMLTAKGQAYDREQGLAVGADLYLTKPFDPEELVSRVKWLLQSSAEALASRREAELQKAELLDRLEAAFNKSRAGAPAAALLRR